MGSNAQEGLRLPVSKGHLKTKVRILTDTTVLSVVS